MKLSVLLRTTAISAAPRCSKGMAILLHDEIRRSCLTHGFSECVDLGHVGRSHAISKNIEVRTRCAGVANIC